MRAGDLRHKITFQQLTVANDSYNYPTQTWTDQITTYAAIWPVRGVEKVEGMKLEAELTHKIRVRYKKDIVPKMRIKFKARYFDILSIVNVDERNIYLEIMASEKYDA